MADDVRTKMEFAVRMTCSSCEDSVREALQLPGINDVFVDVANELVLVETTLPSSVVQQQLESTGKLVVFRGYGGDTTMVPPPEHHGAAVVAMSGRGRTTGLARLVQSSPDHCLIEGTIDGLTPDKDHFIKIHEYGDLSNYCENCGDVFDIDEFNKITSSSLETRPVGDLGVVRTDSSGRALFRMTSEKVKVWDVIGRSLVIHDPVTSYRMTCGIIARSAGLFQNPKKVCTCDGVTIWDEAEKKINNKT
jgi:copper chaperone for superoxide dismutase